MTRKHFAAIAAAMYEIRPTAHFRVLQWTIDCEALATVFYGMNPRFDRARFLNACNGK
jgi:hypothetical protein